MKQLKWIIGGLLLAVVPVFALVGVAHAQRFASTIDEGQKVYSSLYSSGKNIDIKGEIFGDVFCAGQSIKIDATVHGDIICAGQDVTIAGTVDGNIRVAGQVVNIEAAITRNVSAAAATFSLDAGAKVGQDLTAAGGLNIKGEIGRDAVISGDNIVLNGKVGRNVAAKSNNITLKDDAKISGNLNFTGSSQPKRDVGAKVEGKTTQTAVKKESRSYFNPIFYLVGLASLVFIGAMVAIFFPTYLERTTNIIKGKPGRTLLIGGVTGLLVPAVTFGFALTIIGIPVTIFLLMAFLFAAALTGPISGYLVGRLVLSKSNNPLAIALVGGAILVTTYFIPFVGIFFIIAAFWFGFGALVTDLYAHSRPALAHTKK
jgi:cytoskeletal protein CcmA (bactofilin family)